MIALLHSIQIGSSLLLIALVLLQRTSGDIGSTMGDSGSFLQTRRGAERFLFVLTIIIAFVFAASSLAVIILSR
jgi:protein translocase SecG subunit